jgi:hypothetical protein
MLLLCKVSNEVKSEVNHPVSQGQKEAVQETPRGQCKVPAAGEHPLGPASNTVIRQLLGKDVAFVFETPPPPPNNCVP